MNSLLALLLITAANASQGPATFCGLYLAPQTSSELIVAYDKVLDFLVQEPGGREQAAVLLSDPFDLKNADTAKLIHVKNALKVISARAKLLELDENAFKKNVEEKLKRTDDAVEARDKAKVKISPQAITHALPGMTWRFEDTPYGVLRSSEIGISLFDPKTFKETLIVKGNARDQLNVVVDPTGRWVSWIQDHHTTDDDSKSVHLLDLTNLSVKEIQLGIKTKHLFYASMLGDGNTMILLDGQDVRSKEWAAYTYAISSSTLTTLIKEPKAWIGEHAFAAAKSTSGFSSISIDRDAHDGSPTRYMRIFKNADGSYGYELPKSFGDWTPAYAYKNGVLFASQNSLILKDKNEIEHVLLESTQSLGDTFFADQGKLVVVRWREANASNSFEFYDVYRFNEETNVLTKLGVINAKEAEVQIGGRVHAMRPSRDGKTLIFWGKNVKDEQIFTIIPVTNPEY